MVQPTTPGVWTTEGASSQRPTPSTPGNSICKQTSWQPPPRGCRREGKRIQHHFPESYSEGTSTGKGRVFGKTHGFIAVGVGPAQKTYSITELEKVKAAAKDPSPKRTRLESATAEARHCQQNADALQEQRAKTDGRSSNLLEDCRGPPRRGSPSLARNRKQKAETIELNYAEFMHIGAMLEHFVGITNQVATSEGGSVRRKLPEGGRHCRSRPHRGETFKKKSENCCNPRGQGHQNVGGCRSSHPTPTRGDLTCQAGGR